MTTNNYGFNPEQFFNAEAFKPFLNNGALNTETLTAASKEATEAAKTLAQCQTNFAREQMEDIATFWRNWMSSGSNVQDKLEIQNQATREGLAKAMAHSKEVTAIVQKTQEKLMHAFSTQTAYSKGSTTKPASKSTK